MAVYWRDDSIHEHEIYRKGENTLFTFDRFCYLYTLVHLYRVVSFPAILNQCTFLFPRSHVFIELYRFYDQPASLDNYFYSFNPCGEFTEGTCINVAGRMFCALLKRSMVGF